MSKIKTKYGTVINTTDLTPEQIAKVREVAESNGAYGSKGIALADSFRAKNTKAKQPTTPTTTTPGDPSNTPMVDPNAGITPVGGAIDPSALFAAAKANWSDDRAKALRDQAQQSAYSFATQGYDTQKKQELADIEQNMAERGIPYDPTNPKSIYGQSVANIDKKYQDLDYQAKNYAIGQGNQIYQTETQAAQTANDSFINAALGMSQADLAKYGIDQNMIIQMKQIKAQKDAQKFAATHRGGGSGTPVDNTSDIILGG